MGFRFQKRLSILPGVRVNLSKSGISTSLGPRGADVNIGRNGSTANAGIPGTGLSYRSKAGSKDKSGTIGILALMVGLGIAAYKNFDSIEHLFVPVPIATKIASTTGAQPAGGTRFVHRGGSVLRVSESTSGKTLKKESKGAKVILLAVDGPWSQVQDGEIVGWMRTSVLGEAPPK